MVGTDRIRRRPSKNGLRVFAAGAVMLLGGPLVAVSPSAALTQTAIIPDGSEWSFLDNGSDQGSAWSQPGFSTAGWGSGAGELGYGDGDEATVVSYGPDRWHKYATTYFVRELNQANVAEVSAASVSFKYDDGAVVFVNGTEVYWVGMPATFNFATYTGSTREGTASFAVDPALLVEGANVVAVEMHQSTRTSSDISFDLSMTLTRNDTPPVNPRPVNPPPVVPPLTDNIPFGSVYTTGCLWIGGDVRNGGFGVGAVWARGYARFCP